jgi:Pyruvate carboxylase
MSIDKVLIANPGEVAIRIAQACAELGITSVAVYGEDEAEALRTRIADEAVALPAHGVAAQLDVEALINAAVERGCDAIHPGYGLLAEKAKFAVRCNAAGIIFVGPDAAHLELFGDKVRARKAAAQVRYQRCRGSTAP